MSYTVKVDGWDLGTGPGPVAARGCQFSGVLPGGHSSCAFEVLTDNAYLAPHKVLRPGSWVEIRDEGGHELWEGELFTCRPVVDLAGQHKYVVQGGGLLAVAAKRADLSKTWVHRGATDWSVAMEGNRSGEYTLGGEGSLKLLIRQGSKQSFQTERVSAVYYIDRLMSDDHISYVDGTAIWDVADETPYGFHWDMVCGGTLRTESNTTSTGTDFSYTPTGVPVGIWVSLWGIDYTGVRLLDHDKYVEFSAINIYGSSQTAKVRVDQVMVDVATRPGLATSSLSDSIGQVLDDVHFEGMSAAGMLDAAAKLHAQPIDWGFWDQRKFYCETPERRPTNPAKVVVVGGGNPGLVSWDVTESAEEVPEAVCVLFGNHDDASVPEGYLRRLYVPGDPGDLADVRVAVVDYSGLILSDAAAAAAGVNLLSGDGTYALPATPVVALHPELADGGLSAGNNADPTSSWSQINPGSTAGTVTNSGYVAGSGWEGDNTPLDPTCLVLDGTDDYVTFGDLAVADFGTGAYSISVWFRADKLNAAQTIIGKMNGTYPNLTGWRLILSTSNNLLFVHGPISTAPANYVAHAQELETGIWYHACVTYSGSGGLPKLYLNAQEDVLAEDGYTGTVSSSASLNLGAD